MLPHDEMLEIGKMMSDLFKQMIALDTAMVAAVITIVEKVFTTKRILKSSYGKAYLLGSVLFFILSLLFSLVALVEIANNLALMLQGMITEKWVGDSSFYGSIVFFALGILSFILLAGWSFTSSTVRESHTAEK